MSENISTSVQYITVFPKGKDRWKYYINDNFKDSHIIKTDDLKNFIIKKIRPPINSDIVYMISKYFNFIVDIPHNKVYRLLPNDKNSIKKLRMKSIESFLSPEVAYKEYDKKKEKQNKDFRFNNENLINNNLPDEDVLTI